MAVLHLSDVDPGWRVVSTETANGLAWHLTKAYTACGRNPDCDVVLPFPAVARKHFLIHCRFGGCYLEDLRSRCGTYLDQGPGYNNGGLRPDCEIYPGCWQIIGLTPLRDGDVFGHPNNYLRLERMTTVSPTDWSTCSNSQGLLLAIRGTPAADPCRLRQFLESCIALLEQDDQDPEVIQRLREHPDAWSAAAGLARFVVAKASSHLQEKLWGGGWLLRQCDGEFLHACEEAEFRVCRLLRGAFDGKGPG